MVGCSQHEGCCGNVVKMSRGRALAFVSLIATAPPPRLVARAFLPASTYSQIIRIPKAYSSTLRSSRSMSITALTQVSAATAAAATRENIAPLETACRGTVMIQGSRYGTRATRHNARSRYPRGAAATSTSLYAFDPSDTLSDAADSAGNQRSLDVDPASLARAREAAKMDDYEWFMEFIEKDDEGAAGIAGDSLGHTQNSTATGLNPTAAMPGRRGARGAMGGEWGSGADARQRYGNRRTGMRSDDDGDDLDLRRPPLRNRPRAHAPPSQDFQSYGGGVGRGRREIRPTAADRAYDYDLDEEFDREEGRGGWEYDAGQTEGAGTRRRDQGLDVGKVRARARRVAVARRPLAGEGFEGQAEGQMGEEVGGSGGGAQEGTGVEFTPVDIEKAKTLVVNLGYTEDEAACIDPDMADLAIERGIRRPSSGLPPDWVAAGAPPWTAETITSNPVPDNDLETSGALDLDEILYGSSRGSGGVVEVGEGARRSRVRPERSAGDRERASGGGSAPSSRAGSKGQRESRRYYYGDDDDDYDYYDRDEGYYDKDDDEYLSNRRRDPPYLDWQPSLNTRDSGRERERESRKRQGRRARPKKRELDPAETYERRLFSWGEEEDDLKDKIWTGIGPDGPWPTYEEFTQLLRDETDLRLSLVGPWAAEIVSLENAFRLKAYKAWLEVLDKGIGETLLESEFFDAAFTSSEDEDNRHGDGADNLYDTYTDYGSRQSRGGVSPASSNTDTGRYGETTPGGRSRSRRGDESRPSGSRSKSKSKRREKVDVGTFLRNSAESLMQPAEGMEEQAARFEREYPGRRRRPTEEEEEERRSEYKNRE